jgi:hypothetical protein
MRKVSMHLVSYMLGIMICTSDAVRRKVVIHAATCKQRLMVANHLVREVSNHNGSLRARPVQAQHTNDLALLTCHEF